MARGRARTVAMALSLLSVVAVGGCSTQRPFEQIRVSAERAAIRGDYETASREYELIVDRYPGDWRAQYGLGTARLELGELAAARQSLRVAHELRPRDEAIADALAEVMARQGDEDGLFTFLRGQAERTRSVAAYRRLARHAREMGDLDTAKTAINTAIEYDAGSSVDPYLDAADFAQRIGDLDEAVRRLQQAYRIDPNDPRVRQRLIALGEIPGPTLALPPDR